MQIHFARDPGQKFACRDCPSKCCKNWTVDITRSDLERFQSQPWVNERLKESKANFTTLGPDHYLLPVIEVNRQMQCAFLETDGLCGLHKRFGHDFLASTCQTFPFDFIEGETGEILVITSQVCPSIRENYGTPLEELLEKKFQESGGVARKQSPSMILGLNTRLNITQYSALFREWEKIIAQENCPPLALALCFRLNEQLVQGWETKLEVGNEEFLAKLDEAGKELKSAGAELFGELLFESRSYHRVAQVLLVSVCLPLTYPLRSRVLFQGVRKIRFLNGVLKTLFQLLLTRGNIDAIHLGEVIPLEADLWKNKVVGVEQWGIFQEYLLKVLRRRKFAMTPQNMGEILFLMAMALGSYGFFAKLRAAGCGRKTPDASDFREALSAVEMSVLHLNSFLGGSVREKILGLLVKIPNTIPRLLTAEVSFEALSRRSREQF